MKACMKRMRLYNAVASLMSMTLALIRSLYHTYRSTALEENAMTATYTLFDVFPSLDGYAAPPAATGPATGGKRGPELLDHRQCIVRRGAADEPRR